MTTEEFEISWLHCNICHRAFDGHNQVKLSGDRIVLTHSNLYFYFTGCGHFFCENCLKQESRTSNIGSIRCKICGEQSQAFKIHSTIPEKVAMYLKPPIGLLEDSLSIMMFQLNNANKLISVLRAKISSQKDLLMRAKQEIANVKDLKERIKFLEGDQGRSFNPANSIQIDPNESFRVPSEFQQPPMPPMAIPNHMKTMNNRIRNSVNVPHSPFINGTPVHFRDSRGHSSTVIPPPDSPLIHASGRLSLKSPSMMNNVYNPHQQNLNSPFPNNNNNNHVKSKYPRPVIRKP